MNARVRCLAESLGGLSGCARLDELVTLVNEHAITVEDVAEYLRFDLARYHRELLVKADDYQILVLSWLPGQTNPIHNHRGSQCCVRVLQGTAVETVYTHTRDGFFETRTGHYAVASVLGGEDADIHTVENLASARDGLVTMHVELSRLSIGSDGRLTGANRLALRFPAG